MDLIDRRRDEAVRKSANNTPAFITLFILYSFSKMPCNKIWCLEVICVILFFWGSFSLDESSCLKVH